jgi:hypothetical protein
MEDDRWALQNTVGLNLRHSVACCQCKAERPRLKDIPRSEGISDEAPLKTQADDTSQA